MGSASGRRNKAEKGYRGVNAGRHTACRTTSRRGIAGSARGVQTAGEDEGTRPAGPWRRGARPAPRRGRARPDDVEAGAAVTGSGPRSSRRRSTRGQRVPNEYNVTLRSFSPRRELRTRSLVVRAWAPKTPSGPTTPGWPPPQARFSRSAPVWRWDHHTPRKETRDDKDDPGGRGGDEPWRLLGAGENGSG